MFFQVNKRLRMRKEFENVYALHERWLIVKNLPAPERPTQTVRKIFLAVQHETNFAIFTYLHSDWLAKPFWQANQNGQRIAVVTKCKLQVSEWTIYAMHS